MYKIFKEYFAILLVILTTYYMLHTTATMVSGQAMSNENYILQTEGVNPVADTAAGANSSPQGAIAKPDPSVAEGVNFRAKSGFENLISASPFSVSLSSDIVDFGILSPTNPIIRTVDLSVNSLATYGYSVIAFENEPLMTVPPAGKAIIPDTTCDSGACGVENAAEWTNALTYGFGYRCDNLAEAHCGTSFDKANAYKHFSDIANNDGPVSIIAGNSSNNQSARISYKVNISGNQTQGIYSNIVTYIAIPNF